MSQRPAILPDPFDFARRGARVEGEVDAVSLVRMRDVLDVSVSGQSVRYSASGRQEGDKLFLDIEAGAALVTTCQRCLEEMRCEAAIETSLLLVPPGQALPDDGLEDDSFDPVHAGRDFDLLAAIEDELLLAMPISLMHDECHAPVDMAGNEKASPFAVLGRLKRKE